MTPFASKSASARLLLFPCSSPFLRRLGSACSTCPTTTRYSMSGSALRSASRRLWNIRELLFSAIEKSLVAGENHLPQLREFRNVGVVRFLCDASLKFKRLSHRPFGLFGHLR